MEKALCFAFPHAPDGNSWKSNSHVPSDMMQLKEFSNGKLDDIRVEVERGRAGLIAPNTSTNPSRNTHINHSAMA